MAIARAAVRDARAASAHVALAAAVGARLANGAAGVELLPPGAEDVPAVGTLAGGFVVALPDLAVVTVAGEDAVKFLHAQVTNDLAALPDRHAQWNGYCTARGRLLAAAPTWNDAGAIRLALPAPQAAALAKRLRMYVLRAKVRIDDAPDGLVLLGVGGTAAPAALAALGLDAPAPMRLATAADGCAAVGLPPVDPARAEALEPAGTATEEAGAPSAIGRWLLAVPADRLDTAWRTLAATLAPAPTAAWRWLEVLSGVPRIVGGSVEQFVPQMVNLERVDGVNFRKGCYPGQEVVARSQYLGKLRRRMFLAVAGTAAVAPGDDIHADGCAEPVGQVVLAAPGPDGRQALLFEASRDVVDASFAAGALHAGAPDGAVLVPRALPYTVPEPQQPPTRLG